jgi:hypothetical protein
VCSSFVAANLSYVGKFFKNALVITLRSNITQTSSTNYRFSPLNFTGALNDLRQPLPLEMEVVKCFHDG